ncbi:unnamed protein product [Sympodiomycopsis kandeliae]
MDDSLELSTAFDYVFKIILVGDSSTGKTTLLHHFIHHEYVSKSHTVGVEFTSRILLLGPTSPNPSASSSATFQSDSQQKTARGHSHARGSSRQASAVRLQLWDTAGQERFRSVTRSYYRGAAGCLLVYDVTKRSTFDSLPSWLADVRSLASSNLMVVVIGNKTDLADEGESDVTNNEDSSPRKTRQVEWEEGKRWADSEGLVFIETSSLTGHNVESPFTLCARGILSQIESGAVDPDQNGSGIAYGDRSLRPGHSRSGSVSESVVGGLTRFSFADVVQNGGGVSKGAARGMRNSSQSNGLIKVRDALGLKSKQDGGCC